MIERRKRLFYTLESTLKEIRETMAKKNQDYSGGTNDPYANFTAGEYALGVPVEIGMLMRTMDKFQRIRSFVLTGNLAVKSESVDDAINDSIAYLILLKGYVHEFKGVGKNVTIQENLIH